MDAYTNLSGYAEKGYPVPEPSPRSPVLAISGASSEVTSLVTRLKDLADRLCGPEPTGASGGVSAAPVSGVFPALDHMATEIQLATSDGNRAISRIEKKLP